MRSIAPNFKTVDPSGNDFELYRALRERAVILVFYRGYWCNHCREQLSEINNRLKDFERLGAEVVAISADRPLEASLIKNFLSLKFTVLPDADWEIFGLYGFERPKDVKEILPAIFIINKNKEIIYKFVGKNYTDRPSIETLIDEAKKL